MSNLINQYPSVEDLRSKARKRVPSFAFDYLDGGCNENNSLKKNCSDLSSIKLEPRYLRNNEQCSTRTTLFGKEYDAPLGIAPVGLQGLIWPNSPEILAKASLKQNIPFLLSTVTTMAIEKASELTEGNAWFQLYNPKDTHIRKDIIKRAAVAQCDTLVLLCDVPTFGYRHKDYKNHLALPPNMILKNILQVLGKPTWLLNTLRYGAPTFNTLKPYMPNSLNLKQLGAFMDKTFSGKLNAEKIKPIRDQWKGKLILKGVTSRQDTEDAIKLGFDGLIISNHGGRQLDPSESTINVLKDLAPLYGSQINLMIDGGLRSGPDIARAMACGAKFTFMGRPFMYGVAALGKRGGNHTASILKTQFKQVMEQLCCEKVAHLPNHLLTK